MLKTVLELDLVGYSTICANLEEGLDVSTGRQLNEQIQSFISAGVKAVGASRDQTVISTAGDNAILAFDSPGEAHRCAAAVHTAAAEHNRARSLPLAKRTFRGGAATGEIVMTPKVGGGFDVAGMAVIRAVRLEAKANPGGLLIDEATHAGLSEDQRRGYGSKTRVPGKREEEFDAYGYQFDADGPANAAFFTEQSAKDEGDASQEAPSDPFELAQSDEAAWKRVNAVRRIDDQDQLEKISRTEGEGNVRAAAIRRLQNQKTLERLARTDPFARARLAAVERLESKNALATVVRDDASDMVRSAARERLEAIGASAAPAAQVESEGPPPLRVQPYRWTSLRKALFASGIGFLLVVGAVSLAYWTPAPLLVASCAWTLRVDTNPDYPLSLVCRFENRGKEPAEETVLELPFLCSRASLDGSEASRYFGEKVFREDARPPAPFTIGVIGAGRSRSAAFVPLTKGLRVPNVDWCEPSAYLLRDGKRQGEVEITVCMP